MKKTFEDKLTDFENKYGINSAIVRSYIEASKTGDIVNVDIYASVIANLCEKHLFNDMKNDLKEIMSDTVKER